MKFLLVLCLGFASAFGQGQDFSIPTMPLRNTPEASTQTTSAGDSGQASIPQPSQSAALNAVDAPSAAQAAACTQKNGKPCPEWLHKLIGQYPPVDQHEAWNGQADHFFNFGNARRVLHPDRKSWILFSVAQAGMWASAIAAVRDHRTSGEGAHSEYPAVALLTGMDLLVFKTISPAISVGPPVYAMVHYSRAASK